MLLSKEVEINITIKEYNIYSKKGYDIPTKINRNKLSVQRGTKCLIKIGDLELNSHAKILYRCDYCGIEKYVPYCDYMKHYPNGIKNDKDACLKCSTIKTREKMIEKYGVENSMELDFVKDKIKKTNMKRYGVECSLNTEECKNTIRDNNIKKYGVPFYSMTDECKDKVRDTNNKKYGVDYYSKTEIWVNNVKETVLEKYGVDNVSKIEEVKFKKSDTFYKNSTVATSRQQLYLHKLLGGILNYSNNSPSLDIAFPEEKIYIEFNGSGHDLCVKLGNMTQEYFDNRERARYYYMKNKGWKAIIINSKRDYLPNDEIILNEILKAREWFRCDDNGHSHYIINIGAYMNDDKYGKLRKIKEEDLETAIW